MRTAARQATAGPRFAFSRAGQAGHGSPCRRHVAVRAWNDDVKFQPAKVVSSKQAATNMHVVTVDVGKDIAATYKKGGQYLQMKKGEEGKPAYFAIANAPEASKDGRMEFLIKYFPDSNHADIISSKEGDEVLVTEVAGKGFPVDTVPPSDVDTMLIFATGSGISPVKALIDADALQAKERKDVRLYYGTHDADSMAYADLIPEWESKGVKVTRVYATAGEGWVQDKFSKDTDIEDGSKACALLCGQKEMAFAVKDLLKPKGVADERFLTNF